MQILTHPVSKRTISGVQLLPGSKISAGDRYDSTSGAWELCGHVVGQVIQPGCTTIWVRSLGPLSDNACILLGYVTLGPWGARSCIAERDGVHYFIPSPTFNWDGRYDIYSARVAYPECIQELIDHGYLSFGVYEVGNWMSDYSTVGENHHNQVYVLTEEGKRKGAEIVSQYL